MRRRILLRAGLREDGGALEGVSPADGLLLVSGSHPARGALRWTGMLRDSRAGLKEAAALKRQGLLPQSTALWAVVNPLTDAAASLERKARKLSHAHAASALHGLCGALTAASGTWGHCDMCMLVGQVAAGAEAILTQPPLLWHRFESWYEGVER